ncbi:MAG TPA: insecticidal toxin protein [Thermoanaerobaculia bacterium]|nr:insecticidal toxin protein [Thermoanaerobaculia bacterium]
MMLKAKAARFHGVLDTELARVSRRYVETKETKYFVIQQRTLSYDFSLHQHPYVQQLMRRLLREGTSGLQAADTHYEPHAALPGSVEVTLEAGTGVTIGAASKIALLGSVQAFSGAVPIALASDMKLQTLGAAAVRLTARESATLAAGMAETPAVGAVFPVQESSAAVFRADTKIALISDTALILHDGTAATVLAGTEVLFTGGTPFTMAAGTPVTLRGGKRRPVLFDDFFGAAYRPSTTLVRQPHPVKDLDFSSGGAYAVYNWELFFHVPLTIAIHLSRNQRFAEAQRWFHYLFDPTDDSDGPTPERFWKVRPFQSTDVKKIEEVLVNLVTGADETLRDETVRSIQAWESAPFRPHVIARYRQQAYMYKTIMAYLDNLIAWGDSLFRQDTGEAIDEAMMVYVLAANILGPRPQPVPKKGTVRPQTYANLRKDLHEFGTVLRDVESDLPFDLMPFPASETADHDRLATVRSLGKALYFCVPRNDKLLSYWDTVADRLFKIRNSLNLQGVFRQLALFDPPIDPGALARATAAGLDVSAIINGLNQPLPLVRFQFLVQKATEIVQEVKSLGNSLLSAMEKEDGEAMAILRSKHERAVMAMVEHVRYGQLQEAIKSKEGLLQTLALAVQRYTYYERQLGKKADEIEKAIPELVELDRDTFDKMKLAMKEGEVALREIEVDISQDLGESGGRMVSSYESEELRKSGTARDIQETVRALQLTAQGLALIPDSFVDAHFWGVGGTISTPGGKKLAAVAGYAADVVLAYADHLSYEAGQAAKIGSYARREQDWAFQSNLAAGEINQIIKQLRAAEIREAVADWELKSHRQQMKQAAEMEQFLNEEGTEKKGKKTNKALYAWMKREVRGLYSQCFQFAFDIARKAERALQHELGNPGLSYLQFGYLTGKEGLLAGEKLHLDVKRMEMAYHDLNQREYELTRHVSLLQVDPLALIRLRTTGRCTVRLPEELFDADGPGHYFRRIKTVAVSIPCVTGPFTGVNCTLTLLKSSIRKSPVVQDREYAREGAEDDRFSDYFGSVQSIVTSSGQYDSGLFETNLRDERYLPFENSGAISEWQLTLPANPGRGEPAQFDYDTISDVVLHVRYTAREGGGLLRSGAIANTAAVRAAGTVRLLSVRHEFPTEWAKFRGHTPPSDERFELTLDLRREHYPFWAANGLKRLTRVDVLVRSAQNPMPNTIQVADGNDATAKTDPLAKDSSLGNLLVGTLANVRPSEPLGKVKLFFDTNAMADLWIAVTWGE